MKVASEVLPDEVRRQKEDLLDSKQGGRKRRATLYELRGNLINDFDTQNKVKTIKGKDFNNKFDETAILEFEFGQNYDEKQRKQL